MATTKTDRKPKVLHTVQQAWWAFERVCQSSELLTKALDESIRIEKEHRRFCAFNAAGRYSMSVEWAARYFVVRNTYQVIPVPNTWKDFAGYRSDFPLCQSLRETFGAVLPPLSEAFTAIDYAGDIALKSGRRPFSGLRGVNGE